MISDNDKKRIEDATIHYDGLHQYLDWESDDKYTPYQVTVVGRKCYTAAATAECEYWQSKNKEKDNEYKKLYGNYYDIGLKLEATLKQLKERDELLAEMAQYVEMDMIKPDSGREKLLTRYANLKAK